MSALVLKGTIRVQAVEDFLSYLNNHIPMTSD